MTKCMKDWYTGLFSFKYCIWCWYQSNTILIKRTGFFFNVSIIYGFLFFYFQPTHVIPFKVTFLQLANSWILFLSFTLQIYI